MLGAILNKSWRQHPTKHQLYGHLPPITKTIQVKRTRHAGHCWRSRAHKWWTPMDPHIWPGKSRTTSSNIHTSAMWGYRMYYWRPSGGDDQLGEVAREGQGYPCKRHDMMMIYIHIYVYIYIKCNPQTDGFVVSKVSSVTRHAWFFKYWLYSSHFIYTLSIIETSYCIAAYVTANKFPHEITQSTWGSYTLSFINRLFRCITRASLCVWVLMCDRAYVSACMYMTLSGENTWLNYVFFFIFA